jgi:hypothetical protein
MRIRCFLSESSEYGPPRLGAPVGDNAKAFPGQGRAGYLSDIAGCGGRQCAEALQRRLAMGHRSLLAARASQATVPGTMSAP